MTSFRKFIFGITASFFIPWLCLIVIPHSKMNAEIEEWTDPDTGKVNFYPLGTPNIFRQGQIVYAQEGCASFILRWSGQLIWVMNHGDLILVKKGQLRHL
jgi:hypothetical protein